jgi:hypothetical protein
MSLLAAQPDGVGEPEPQIDERRLLGREPQELLGRPDPPARRFETSLLLRSHRPSSDSRSNCANRRLQASTTVLGVLRYAV